MEDEAACIAETDNEEASGELVNIFNPSFSLPVHLN